MTDAFAASCWRNKRTHIPMISGCCVELAMSQSRALRRYDWTETIDELVFNETAAERRRRLAQRAKDGKKAREIDRTGNVVHLERAAKRLKHVKAENRVLI